MQAILPIAGKSSRMAKKYQGPKQLLPVLGKPLVEYMLESLPEAIDELVLVVGGPYENEIRAYFGDEHGGRKISYVRQEQPLGLGHAIQQAKDLVKGRFIITAPDDIYNKADLEKMIAEPDMAALTMKRDDWQNFGVFVLDENGYIKKMVEKPKEFVSPYVSAGACYVLDQEFFDVTVPPSGRGEIELPDIVNALINERGRKCKAIETSFWVAINDPDQLDVANDIMRARIANQGEN